jgi:plastocyanin
MMSIERRSLLVAMTVVAAAAGSARAQTTCATPNCVQGGKPAVCVNVAAPRTPNVSMTVSGINFVFVPANPKIEPGDCITWTSSGATHSSATSGCVDDSLCGAPPVASCNTDTGNVATTVMATCSYDPAIFPAGTGNAYYCRIHATPTTGTMRGTLQVTTPIVLSVNKDIATNSVKLTWTGGGVTGYMSYKVARDNAGNPAMPAVTTTTVNPDTGVTGTTFTDTGDLLNATTHFYLVRNKQTNEP